MFKEEEEEGADESGSPPPPLGEMNSKRTTVQLQTEWREQVFLYFQQLRVLHRNLCKCLFNDGSCALPVNDLL